MATDRELLEGLILAARNMVRVARPHVNRDPELAAAWQALRRSIPIKLVGSGEEPKPEPFKPKFMNGTGYGPDD